MLDICLLGTSGMAPLPDRYLTALLIRYGGKKVLIDCGEGTQVTMKIVGWGFKSIDIICITHYHGDHINGIAGVIMAMANSVRTEPLTIIGPPGLHRILNGLLIICTDLPFKLKILETEIATNTIEIGEFFITTIPLNHKIPCLGYSIEIKRPAKFMLDKAEFNKVPQPAWRYLQLGESVQMDGKTYTPDMVLGPPRKGFKVSYVTDSRPSDKIVSAVAESDLFVCESMYMDYPDLEQVKKYKHMLGVEAAQMAKEARVKNLWLTHYSPAVPTSSLNVAPATAIFEHTQLGVDRKTCTLTYED
ncbi:ribonuclease Z [Candidatus Epulonipiscium viviparus]|uniref:ribonuclease Z n=1 Tax=Candidatus Epulonipiscium viviparus TaxID=420336 RepID=UPI0027380E36|nr:ribonuclease Z [Candidatus Epulopiscium viviparus]